MQNARLIDFGFVGSVAENTTYIGSIAYAAPEVLQGVPYMGEKVRCAAFYSISTSRRILMYQVDVWGIGVIMHTLLAGVQPFAFQGDLASGKQQLEHIMASKIHTLDETSSVCQDLLPKLLHVCCRRDFIDRSTD